LIFVGLRPAYSQQAGIGVRIAGSEPVVIVAVYGGSPADKAGILPGDELLAVNDVASSNASAVTAAMSHHPAGEPVRLTIRRDGADQTVTVEPEEWVIAFDQPVHVLPGWEGRYRYLGCHVHRDQFATRAALAVELASLREEIRKLRNELNEMNARRVARPGDLTEE
jgi:C-terminal processing protease CtpA/Prc